MRTPAYWLPLLLIVAGCQGVDTTLPDAATWSGDDVPPAGLAAQEHLLGLWHLSLDPATLHATLALSPERAAMVGVQGRGYDLDIAAFLNGATLRVTDVRRDATTGDILLGIAHQHPFPAPDFTKNINAKNRADLGYTGKLLILADAEHIEFAPQGLTVDPTLIRLPDGYAATGDLLYKAGVTNNLFPYKLLVDEALDNRVGVSNGSDPLGNYDPATGGWQRANAGTNRDDWTGYDYLHGGQSITTSLVIPKDKAEAGPVEVDLTILIKYTDPRGIVGPTKRFPAEPVKVTDFAYRLPQAAMDVSRCTTCGELQLLGNTGAFSTIQVTLRDWDATATAAGDDDLSDESDVALVEPGSPGFPVVTAICPTITAIPVDLTRDGGTGLPGDEFIYSAKITNTIGSLPTGTHYALVVATDPEQDAPSQDQVHFGVDPTTLISSAARRLPIRSFQLVPIRVTGYNGWSQSVEPTGAGTVETLSVDSNGRVAIAMSLNFQTVDADPGPCVDLRPGFGNTDIGIAWYDAQGNYEQFIRIGGAQLDFVRSATFDPVGGLLISGRFTSTSIDFDPGPGTAILTNGTNFATGFLARYLPDGTFDRVYSYGIGMGGQAEAWAIDIAPDNSIYLCGDAYGVTNPVDMDPTAGEDLITTDNNDVFISKWNADGSYGWTRTISGGGPEHQFDSGRMVLATADGGVAFAGGLEKSADLDPGPASDVWMSGGLFNDAFWVKLDSDGVYQWGRMVGSAYADIVWGLGEQSNQNIIVAGMWGGTIDFDTSPGGIDIHNQLGTMTDVFVSRYTPTGTWLKSVTWGNEFADDRCWSADISANDSIFVCGEFGDTTDFDPGAGTSSVTAEGRDAYVVRLMSDLTFQWVETVQGIGSRQGRLVRSAPNNTAILGFTYNGETDVHPGAPVVPLTGSGAALVRYPANGSW